MSSTVAPSTLVTTLGDGWRRPRGEAQGLADAIRALVVDGRLAVRTRIPSERALAPALGLSRGTVSRAYDRLREDGYLVSARGAGSWLTLPAGAGPAPPPSTFGTDRGLDLTTAALPAPEPLLSEAAAKAAAQITRHTPGFGFVAQGIGPLREAIADRYTQRGAPTTADQILVTNGAQQALHLLLTLLVTPGDRVLVDAPAYPRTLSAVRTARARAVPVPLTPTGWDVTSWAETATAAAPRLAITIPDYHNPTGLSLAGDDRHGLAQACARAGVTLIADETTAELRIDGPSPPRPLAAHDQAVVTIGSMSKSAWGGLRIGWVRAAPRLVRELAATRADHDIATPVLEQLIAVELLHRWDETLASRTALLRPRRDALLEALPATWRARKPGGGLSAWVKLPAPVATRLAAAAARERILITPGPSFSVDGTFERHVRLPFCAPSVELKNAVAILHDLAGRLGASTAEVHEALPTAV
jgi:DNA-binding transcriptional MocR family regulator